MCGAIFFFQAEDGIRDYEVTGVQTCALPILPHLYGSRCKSPIKDFSAKTCRSNGRFFVLGNLNFFEILICMGLFYANGYMLLMRCRKETVYCFEKSAIRDEVRLVGMQCLFSG